MKKLMLIFFLLLGVSRMLLLPDSTETEKPFLLTIAPKPFVFLNENYFTKQLTRFYFSKSQYVEIDFNNKKNWPFKSEIFLSFYPVLRVLDRPKSVPIRTWKTYIDYFICQRQGNVFNEFFLSRKYFAVEAYQLENGRWLKIQEHRCLD